MKDAAPSISHNNGENITTNKSNLKKKNMVRNGNKHGETSNNNVSANNGRHQLNASRNKSESIYGEIFDESETRILVPVLIVRALSILGWTGAILYATRHVYLACEEHLNHWFKDPVMNPSALSGIFNRGKDASDYEWEMFSFIYTTRLWFWYGLYAVMSRIVQPVLHKEWSTISLCLSSVMFWELVGFLPTVFMLLQPLMYWLIAKTRSRLLAWTATVFFIYNLNSPITRWFIPINSFSEYFFVITSAWNFARCISFCYDVWDVVGENNTIGLKSLKNLFSYCFYLPLVISGPLVTYESFERNIINRDVDVLRRRNLSLDFINLLKKLAKIAAIVLMNEIILHFLYFRALSMTTVVHRHLNLWAICGTVYWLGQFFALKYKVLYGIPSAIAEFEGMEMPPLPTCPSHMHRYSALWREFDPGLYRFLVRYIYVPTLKYIKDIDVRGRIPVDIQKLMASFVTYVYVFIWHSLTFEVFVWTALNFMGITIERVGSVIKKKVDRRMNVDQIHWDFVIEPIVTAPLAGMSILISSIFCGSIEAAASFGGILWERRQDNWVLVFLYCMAHTGVTHRTWKYKLYQLFSKLKTKAD